MKAETAPTSLVSNFPSMGGAMTSMRPAIVSQWNAPQIASVQSDFGFPALSSVPARSRQHRRRWPWKAALAAAVPRSTLEVAEFETWSPRPSCAHVYRQVDLLLGVGADTGADISEAMDLDDEDYTSDPVDNSKGLAFYCRMNALIEIMKLFHVTSVMAIYALALDGRRLLALWAVLVAVLVSTGFQHYVAQIIKQRLLQFASVRPLLMSCWLFKSQLVVLDAESDPYIPPGGWCILFVKRSIVFSVLSLTRSIDHLLDALAAGTAQSLLSTEASVAFTESWKRVPVVGSFIGEMGISGALSFVLFLCTAIVSVSSLVSLFIQWRLRSALASAIFKWNALSEKYVRPDGIERLVEFSWLTQSHFWSCLSFSAEVGSLARLAELFEVLSKSWRNFLGLKYVPAWRKLMKVVVAVFATAPQAWLQVSVLGLGLEFQHYDRLSVVTTSTSIFLSLIGLAICSGSLWHTTDPKMWRTLPVKLLSICLGVALLGTTIRFVMTFTCRTHNFSLMTFQCMPWESKPRV